MSGGTGIVGLTGIPFRDLPSRGSQMADRLGERFAQALAHKDAAGLVANHVLGLHPRQFVRRCAGQTQPGGRGNLISSVP